MKYVITDNDEARVGRGYHSELVRGLSGKVIRAGHCELKADGKYKVWGESLGFGIMAKSDDAHMLDIMVCPICKGEGEIVTPEGVLNGEMRDEIISPCACKLKESLE